MPAAAGIFMKFGSIQGDADDPNHKGWIVLNGVRHATGREMSMDSGRTEQATQTRYFGDLDVSKRLDIASTALMNNCLKGSIDVDAEIQFSYLGDSQKFYEQIKITQTLVTYYNVWIDNEGNSGETLTLTFVSYDQEYGTKKLSYDRKTQEMND
jgi:type VI secretion system secreted protein Hcp